MDFKLVTQKLLTAFKENDIRYGLIGGYALGLWGVDRSTIDIDFLANRDDMQKVDKIMQGLGYECKYKSENASQYVSPLNIYGEVDFLHAFREASLGMLKRAEEKEISDGSIKIRVLKPEDIIGLKVQAIYNNPSRKQDIVDIESLLAVNGYDIDWILLEKYFNMFDMGVLYKRMRQDYKK